MRMLIQIREFDREKDYEMVRDWWAGHGWTPVPLNILPKLGVIAYEAKPEGNTDTAAAWLYMDNSIGVCMLEWTVTRPGCTGRAAVAAIQALTEYLTLAAREMNYFIMLTTAKQPSLCRLHERNGFIRTDDQMVHFMKGIEGSKV